MSPSPGIRRRLLGLTAGLAAVITLTACSSSGGSSDNATTGGTLTMQFAGVPISLDPALGGSAESAVFTSLAYDPLIYITGDGDLIPDLATKWEFNSDNTVLTLTLRSGVTFTDGSKMDAAAVKASMDYFLGAGGGNLSAIGPVDHVDAPSSDTVAVTYKSPFPDGAFFLTQFWGFGEIIGPTGLADPKSLLTASDGAGQYAYTPSASVTGSSYAYTRNKKYFNPDAQQYDKVLVKVIGDPSAVLSAASTGQVDFAGGTPTTAASAKSGGLKVITAPFFNWGLTVTDTQGTLNPALKSAQVRQAMALAIDRDSLANALGADFTTANGQLANKGTAGYLDGFGFTQDIAKAKSLLADAGYPDGFTLDVLTENILDNQTTISQAIASDLGKIGVKVNLIVKNSVPDFIGAGLTKQYPALIWPITGTNSAQFLANFLGTNLLNPFGNTDPKLTDAYSKSLTATSDSERKDAFENITTASNDVAWFLPAISTQSIYYVGKKIENVRISATNSNPLPQAPDAKYAWKHSS